MIRNHAASLRIRKAKLYLCSFTMSLCLPIQAQQPTDTITGKVHTVPEIEVEARRISPQLTSAAPMQQMGKVEMERLGVADVADAVRHFSGVSVKDYGGIGGLKTVSIRSMGAQHTAVSYDGVAVSDCQSGQVDISRFSLENVSELTLSIGQSDNIYQTAKMFASAGTLNIETARPNFDEQSYHVMASVNAGSFGLVSPSLLYAQKLSKVFALTVYGNFLRADGNYPFKLRNGTTWIDSKRNNSDIDTYRAEINIFATINEKQDLKVKLYLFDSSRGLPGGVIYDNPYAAERLYDRNYFGQIKYENRFSEKWKLQIGGKFNYSWTRDYNTESSGITDDRFRQTESYASATLWTEPIKGLSFSLAQDFAYNHLHTTLKNNQSPERFTYLAVIAAHYKTDHFSATASLLNTFITENVSTGEAAADREHLSPAVSLSWKPFDFGLRFRASYKDIFRVPTFNDMYYLEIGNSDLQPETTRQGNIGITWNTSRWGLIDYLSLSIDAYYNKVKDKIVAMPTMFIWKMMNLGKVETIGTDVNLSAEIKINQHHKLYLMGTYNFMQAEDITDPTTKVWRNQIVYTPKHSGSGSLTWENAYVNVTYNLLYASERYFIAQNIEENRMDPYTDHSVSLSHRFRWKRHALRIQFDVQNLSGKNYEIIRYYPMAGCNYKITLNYSI